jgi:transposase
MRGLDGAFWQSPARSRGKSREDTARSAGMDRQTLRDWVIRYNEHGLDGLVDCWGDGRPPKLDAVERVELVRIVLARPRSGDERFVGFHARGSG